MTTLKDKMNYYCNDWNIPEEAVLSQAINKDIKETISNYKMYQYIYNWRSKNSGFKDSKEITEKINHLEKTYNCKYYELGFNEIFGDFEK